MNKVVGKVVAISGEGSGMVATIDVQAAAVCARCAAGKGCGAGLFGKSQTTRRVSAPVPQNVSVLEGDTVQLALEPQELLAAAGIVYGWPLSGAAIGATLSWLGGSGDAVAALSVLAGIAAGAYLARLRLGNGQCLQRFTPRIIH